MKRIISVVLTLCLLTSLLSAVCLADATDLETILDRYSKYDFSLFKEEATVKAAYDAAKADFDAGNTDKLQSHYDTLSAQTLTLKNEYPDVPDIKDYEIYKSFGGKVWGISDRAGMDLFTKYGGDGTFGSNTNQAYTGCTIYLLDDIDMGGSSDPYTAVFYFNGTFDGKDHSIKNVYVDITEPSDNCISALVKRLYGSGIIKNVCIESGEINVSSSKQYFVGGIAAYIQDGAGIYNCSNGANLNVSGTGQTMAGGIVGQCPARKNVSIINCMNTGDITCTAASNSRNSGIVGNTRDVNTIRMYNCLNTGVATNGITTTGYTTGVIDVQNCYTTTGKTYYGTVMTTADAVSSGELAYTMTKNGVAGNVAAGSWGVKDGNIVLNGRAPVKLTYKNGDTEYAVRYTDVDGKQIGTVTPPDDEGFIGWSGISQTYANDTVITAIVGEAASFKNDYTDQNGIVKNTAVALIPSAVSGDVIAVWQGKMHRFTVGENAFASTEAIYEKFGSDSLQIILPAGNYGELRVYGPWEIYGEGYAVNPVTVENDSAQMTESFADNGYSVIDNADVVIDSAATPSDKDVSIVISGLYMTRGFNDANRGVSNLKTSVTLKNNVLERKYLTGNEREFDFRNANNTNTDTAYSNIDEFTIKNMLYINTNCSSGQAMAQELSAPVYTVDGLASEHMPSFTYVKFTATAQKVDLTLKNCFFKNHDTTSARWDSMFILQGHDTSVTSEERAKLDTSVTVSGNTFIDCGSEMRDPGNEKVFAPISLYPQSFAKINITDNNVISTKDSDYQFIKFLSHAISVNKGDYSDKFTFTGNRFIGILPSLYVNGETSVDKSDNYFAPYSTDYRQGVNGDIPSDTNADYYLDYAMTVKMSDVAPENCIVDPRTRTVVLYATAGEYTFDFAKEGVSYAVYGDSACTSQITSADVTSGNATTAYLKATVNGIGIVYTVYVIGVDDVNDIDSANMNKTVADIKDATLYYPSLYGAPSGITVYAYYDGGICSFVTGKNVATSFASMGQYSDDIVIPDNITELDFTPLTQVRLHSKNCELTFGEKRTVKVAAVGDSITEGYGSADNYYGISTENNYPGRLQSMLGDDFEVSNFGKSGTTVLATPSTETVQRQYSQCDRYQPGLDYNADVVIFALGTNDLHTTDRWRSDREFVNGYVELIRQYQALESKPAVYVTLALPRTDRMYANAMMKATLHDMQKLVADMTGAVIIDTYTPVLPYEGNTDHFKDKIHPDAFVYNLLATEIYEAVDKTFTVSAKGCNIHVFSDNVSTRCATPADCQNAATYYVKCDVCGTASDTLTVSVGNPAAHPTTVIAGVTPTYTSEGYKDYYVCETCGAYFEDKGGTKAITDVDNWKTADGKLDKLATPTLSQTENTAVLSAEGKVSRVYWGYIGRENTPYKWFDEFRLLCGDSFTSDYNPENNETYPMTEAGYYRFVVVYNVDGKKVEDVYTFAVESEANIVPEIELDGIYAVLSSNDTNVKKLYYGYIGAEKTPYNWATFKEQAGDTFTADFSPKDSKTYKLTKAGYYRFVVVYVGSDNKVKELVYTVYNQKESTGVPVFDVEGNVVTLNHNDAYSVKKMYVGFAGSEDVTVTTWDEYKSATPNRYCVNSPADNSSYTLKNDGYYKIVVNYSDGNKTKDVYYTFRVSDGVIVK